MAQKIFGRVRGSSFYVTTTESTAENTVTVIRSTLSPDDLPPLVGDSVAFPNGDVRKIISKLTSTEFICGEVLINIHGKTGADGKDGIDGVNGKDGKDGISIKSVKKTSSSGLTDTYTITMTDGSLHSFQINNGTNGANGVDGKDGVNGTNGIDGASISSVRKTSTNGSIDTYTITLTNNRSFTFNVTNGTNGKNGANGVSVKSITKTATNGLVDTYTITFSNNTSTTFTVNNGKDGSKGEKGDPGEKGDKGDSGVIVSAQGQMTFTVEDGELYIYIPSGIENPYELGDDGCLYMTKVKVMEE